MTDNRTTERVDHQPRVREAIDELMREKDAIENRTTELLGTLTAEQVREAIEANSWAETSTIREFNDSSWQAIADELNARAERTCHRVDVNGYSFRFECSACGYVAIVHNCEIRLDELPNYCPNCGRKVVSE